MKTIVLAKVLVVVICIASIFANSQGVSVNSAGTAADPSAILDISSTSQGVLFPRLTQSQITLMTDPANGLVVFCTTDNCFYVFIQDSIKWKSISFGSNNIVPACGFPFIDSRDGHVYNTVLIGTQCWMKENLNYGTMIPNTTAMTDDEIVHKYCYGNELDTCEVYGGLYSWDEAMDWVITEGSQGICPNGYRLPTDDDYKILEGTVDSQYGVGDPIWSFTEFRGYDAGKHLKSQSLWISGGNGLDTYGFKALPGGGLYMGPPNFYDKGSHGYFWTSTQQDPNWKWFRLYYYSSDMSYRNVKEKNYGMSIRCIKSE